jgi:membrane-bound lytic murein transglycosylase A
LRRALAIAALLLGACAARETSPPAQPSPVAAQLTLTRVGFTELPGWSDDRLAEALPALRSSCAALVVQPADRPVGPNALAGTVADWKPLCAALPGAAADSALLRQFFEASFLPLAVAGPDGPDGLFTGYYEPELVGSRRHSGKFATPLYRRPGDLVTVDLGDFRADLKGEALAGRVIDGRLKPYFTRGEIDAGALAGRDRELLWLADPTDAFFLSVQGSGRVRLAEGGTTRVGFAGSNGHPFTAIGRRLVERGELARENVSMQAVRDWLRAHPSEAGALMAENARYIFFREVEGDGPIGTQGVALTPGRSLAVDAALLPLGVPLWLDTTWPAGTPAAGQPLRRLMVAQDTGSAIKGAVRGDVFWGTGEAALAIAGPMKQRGRYFLLLPAAVVERRPVS